MVLLKILQTLDYVKLAKRSVMTILFGIIVLGVIFPMVLKFAVKSVSCGQINFAKLESLLFFSQLFFIRLIIIISNCV